MKLVLAHTFFIFAFLAATADAALATQHDYNGSVSSGAPCAPRQPACVEGLSPGVARAHPRPANPPVAPTAPQ
jgi:hypothetical protein